MKTKDTIQSYLDCLQQKKEWRHLFAEDMTFTSFTSPIKQAAGRDAFIESTKRFYSMVARVEVKDLLVEEFRACALTRYELQPPKGDTFISDVAEIFTVSNGKIESFSIYFDSSPFPKPTNVT